MNIPYQKTDGEFGKRRDCAVVALSNALGISYFDSERFWAEHGRKLNKPTKTREILGNKKVIGDKVLIRINDSPITLNQFLLTNPKGSYLVRKCKHVFAVKDGLILDHLSKPPGSKTILTHIWKVESVVINHLENELPQV